MLEIIQSVSETNMVKRQIMSDCLWKTKMNPQSKKFYHFFKAFLNSKYLFLCNFRVPGGIEPSFFRKPSSRQEGDKLHLECEIEALPR